MPDTERETHQVEHEADGVAGLALLHALPIRPHVLSQENIDFNFSKCFLSKRFEADRLDALACRRPESPHRPVLMPPSLEAHNGAVALRQLEVRAVHLPPANSAG